MAMKVRRIVSGHNSAGKAVVKTDEQITAVPRIGAGISGCEIWSTDQMPIDNSAAAEAAQRAGFVKHTNFVGASSPIRTRSKIPGSRSRKSGRIPGLPRTSPCAAAFSTWTRADYGKSKFEHERVA
jgi:hypothetical protein